MATIEIFYAPGVFDPRADDVRRSIRELGISGVRSVRVSTLYRLGGNIERLTAECICRELFLDPVCQEYRIDDSPPGPAGAWVVEVWLKEGVTDPVAQTSVAAIRSLGIEHPPAVTTGTRYILEGALSRRQVETAARRLLINELIHDWEVSTS